LDAPCVHPLWQGTGMSQVTIHHDSRIFLPRVRPKGELYGWAETKLTVDLEMVLYAEANTKNITIFDKIGFPFEPYQAFFLERLLGAMRHEIIVAEALGPDKTAR